MEDIAADKAATSSPDIGQHPAFGDNGTDAPASSTSAGPSTDTTTSIPSPSFGSGSASSYFSAASYNGPRIEDDSRSGFHNMNDARLPGPSYLPHDKA
jgi:hypothetical protein